MVGAPERSPWRNNLDSFGCRLEGRRDWTSPNYSERRVAPPNECGNGRRLLRRGFREGIHIAGGDRIPPASRKRWTTAPVAQGRPRRSNIAGGAAARPGRGRGLVMFSKPLPRFVIPKTLASGATAFYFNVPTLYRKLGCTVSNEPLGTDYTVACGENGDSGRAAALNASFDEWNTKRKGGQVSAGRVAAYGTVDWLFREYKQSKAYLEKVAPRSRPDYERTILLITDIVTKKGDGIGDRRIRAITPVSADKIYDIICKGPRGLRPRQGEKAVALCRRAWRVVHRLHPSQFDRAVPNPWEGVTKQRRTKRAKAAVTREQVYAFAWGCIELGQPEAAAAPRSSVSSGSSARRMSWAGICDGPTIAARIGRVRSRLNTTKPALSF